MLSMENAVVAIFGKRESPLFSVGSRSSILVFAKLDFYSGKLPLTRSNNGQKEKMAEARISAFCFLLFWC
jgi:hypothetical protein